MTALGEPHRLDHLPSTLSHS